MAKKTPNLVEKDEQLFSHAGKARLRLYCQKITSNKTYLLN